MSRKNTVWCARHREEEEEIKRIINYYKDAFGKELTKLEASMILAIRSKETFWPEKKAIDNLRRVKGV